MAVLSSGGGDGSRRRDAIILTFADAKISVLEFDDSVHGLRTRYITFFFSVLFSVFGSMLCRLNLSLILRWTVLGCLGKYFKSNTSRQSKPEFIYKKR